MANDIDIIIKAIDESKKGLDGARNSLKKFGSQAEKDLELTAKSMSSKFGSVLKKDIGSQLLALSASIGGVGFGLFKSIESGAKLDVVSKAFENLAKNAGLTADVLKNKLQAGFKGTVSDMELFELANNALLLGIPLTAENANTLATASRRLAQAVGKDARYGFESLVTGIGRQSKLMLDNLGIIIDTEKAYENFAKSLGKTSDELTDAEKKTAFFNATMDSVKTKMRALGQDTETAIEAIKRMSVSFVDLTGNLQKLLALEIQAGGSFNFISKAINSLNQGLDALISGKDLEYFTSIQNEYKEVNEKIKEQTQLLKDLRQSADQIIDAKKVVRIQLIIDDEQKELDSLNKIKENIEKRFDQEAKDVKLKSIEASFKRNFNNAIVNGITLSPIVDKAIVNAFAEIKTQLKKQTEFDDLLLKFKVDFGIADQIDEFKIATQEIFKQSDELLKLADTDEKRLSIMKATRDAVADVNKELKEASQVKIDPLLGASLDYKGRQAFTGAGISEKFKTDQLGSFSPEIEALRQFRRDSQGGFDFGEAKPAKRSEQLEISQKRQEQSPDNLKLDKIGENTSKKVDQAIESIKKLDVKNADAFTAFKQAIDSAVEQANKEKELNEQNSKTHQASISVLESHKNKLNTIEQRLKNLENKR